jgi:hypothetical protein
VQAYKSSGNTTLHVIPVPQAAYFGRVEHSDRFGVNTGAAGRLDSSLRFLDPCPLGLRERPRAFKVADPSVHSGPILMFTSDRSKRSLWTETRRMAKPVHERRPDPSGRVDSRIVRTCGQRRRRGRALGRHPSVSDHSLASAGARRQHAMANDQVGFRPRCHRRQTSSGSTERYRRPEQNPPQEHDGPRLVVALPDLQTGQLGLSVSEAAWPMGAPGGRHRGRRAAR